MKAISTLTALLAALLWTFSCGHEQPVEVGGGTSPGSTPKTANVLGVCFMDGEHCVMTYVDLGDYEDIDPMGKQEGAQHDMVPVYVFPSVPEQRGGLPNPWDPAGLYRPFRLQNNVFAGPGRIWNMWEVHSANLTLMAEPKPGIKLWGVGMDLRSDPTGVDEETSRLRTRDLFTAPITSEEEILALERVGDVELVNMFKMVDCPVVEAKPGDEIVNLNPSFPICGSE